MFSWGSNITDCMRMRTRAGAVRSGGRHARMMRALLRWFDAERRELPWRETRGAYAIWVSEIMLQQTRVDTVTPYYERFMALFPTVQALACADLQDVLKAWEGLGYYSRARNLHKAAAQVVNGHGGEIPQSYSGLRKLCGIGDYTAGAILSQAFGQRVSAVDGNVSRVLARWFTVREDIRLDGTRNGMRVFAQNLLPTDRPGDANQALMELGALICTKKPKCDACPMTAYCMAWQRGMANKLPCRTPNKPQREAHVALALVMAPDGRLLLVRRKERLLGGLYGFPVGEGPDAAQAQASLERMLRDWGLDVTPVAALGGYRHVFTHRIWLMRGAVYRANEAVDVPDACWVHGKDIIKLPMPTAMKTYRAWAYDNAKS